MDRLDGWLPRWVSGCVDGLTPISAVCLKTILLLWLAWPIPCLCDLSPNLSGRIISLKTCTVLQGQLCYQGFKDLTLSRTL
jgi:hypothetical protein